MVAYNDIRNAFKTIITKNYNGIPIYDESIQQGFKAPAFFMQLIPINGERENKNSKSRLMMMDVQYFPKDNSTDDAFDVVDGLENLFRDSIDVNGRSLKLEYTQYQTEYDGTGIVLHFNIFINYFELIREEPTGETASEVIVKGV